MGKTVTEQVEAILEGLGWSKNACDCEVCRAMCATPCTPTPEEVLKLVEAGHADKLMPTTVVLKHRGYQRELWMPRQVTDSEGCRCVFQEKGLCSLHESGLKPVEGRFASCKSSNGDALAMIVGKSWDTRLGREINGATKTKK